MAVTKIDGNGNATSITYDATGLFPNKVQRPSTGSTQHIDYYSYDPATGGLNSHTDENGSVAGDENHTTHYSYDIMGRVTSIQYPGGGGSTFCYTNIGGSMCSKGTAPYSLYTSTTADPDPLITTVHTYDGWGRQYRSSVSSDPQGETIVDTTYDSEGRVASVTNPYRSTPAPNDPPYGISSYTYDALGRKTIQTQPDHSIQQWCYSGIATTGQTNCKTLAAAFGLFLPTTWTDVSDETGRRSQQIFDALSRLGSVFEPNPVSGDLTLETDYTYDVFGDLLNVNQVGSSGSVPVVRNFGYDRPSRVTSACNPETILPGQNCAFGTSSTRYIYDFNGNLTNKTDNRGVATTYGYDTLNRLLSKTYLNDPSGTASSCYQYDDPSIPNGKGRLAAQWTQKGNCTTPTASGVLTKTAPTVYDPMGRVLSEQRCMGIANCLGGGYGMTYMYDAAGKLKSYPSGFGGFSFTNAYDASGRVLSVNGTANSVNTSLFSLPAYTPAGALSGARLGTSINLVRTFDSRQRVTGETDSHQ